MLSISRSIASIVIFPIFYSYLVTAIPAADPIVTALAELEKRANGANIIGFSSGVTGWKTRSCNNGFYSTSGNLGNCCASGSCNFITSCRGSSVYYQSGSPANCGNLCGTGTIYHTLGDQNPLYMYNCDFDWTATMTVTSQSSSTKGPATVSVTATATTTKSQDALTVTNTQASGPTSTSVPDILPAGASTADGGSTGSSEVPTASLQPVTRIITNPSGVVSTEVTVVAITAPSSSSSSSNTALAQHNKTSSSKTGLIAGVVVGGIAAIALIVIAVVLLLRRNSNKNHTPPNAQAANYIAHNNQQPPNNQPQRYSQFQYMNNQPAMSQQQLPAYQQNQYQAYNAGMAQEWKMPTVGAAASGFVPSPAPGSRAVSSHGAIPADVHEAAGTPVAYYTAVELPTNLKAK